jgi:hypothetical protein
MIKQGAQFRQARLFNPVGMHTGNPWKLHPENWTEDESRGPVVWHATDDETLPGVNRPHNSPSFAGYRPESEHPDNEWYRDKVGNRFHRDDFDSMAGPDLNAANYGSAVGLHFGSQQAAVERGRERALNREWVHPARIPTEALREGGRPIREMEDDKANYTAEADRRVEAGKALPYRNNVEDAGSTSYRALPETVRTWGEDVMDDRHAHPALKHLARHGYNPAVNLHEDHERRMAQSWGMSAQGEQGTLWDYEVNTTDIRNDQRRTVGFHQEHQDAVAHSQSLTSPHQFAVVQPTGAINRNLDLQREQIAKNKTKVPIKPNLVKTGRREGR